MRRDDFKVKVREDLLSRVVVVGRKGNFAESEKKGSLNIRGVQPLWVR